MDGVLTESVKELASQGTGYILAIVFGIIAVYIYNRLSKQLSEDRTIRDALQEKRIVEARETVSTLYQGVQANVKMAQALDDQSSSRQAFMQLLSQMERGIERNNESWKPEVARIHNTLADILNEVRPRRGS